MAWSVEQKEDCQMKTASLVLSCWVLIGFIGMTALTGCGGSDSGPNVQVSGNVTLDDQPFSGASIWFTSARNGSSYYADLKEDGTFNLTLLDARPSDVFHVSFAGLQGEEHQPKDQVDGAGVPLRAPMPKIPAHYFEGTTSGHEIVISDAKPMTTEIALKSK